MSTRKKPQAPASYNLKDIPAKKAPEYRTVYANFAKVAAAQHDVSLTLCEIVPGESMPEISENVRIVMTPSFARTLITALTKNLEKWEAACAAGHWNQKAEEDE